MAKREESIRFFAKLLIERTKANFDNIVIVDSGSVKGTGKSTFCLEMDLEICKLMGYEFDMMEIVVFDPTNAKIVDKVKMKPDAWPIHVDEASKVAYKRNFADDSQKQLIIFVNVCRKHHKIIFINNPSFWGLDKDLLELADFRVTILKRGMAIIRGKSANPETLDKWMRKKTDEAIEKYAASEMDIEKMIIAIRNAPNYLFEIHYPPLSAEFYAKYEEVSKNAELESFYDRVDDTWRVAAEACLGIIASIKKDHKILMSWGDVATTINRYAKYKKSENKLDVGRLGVIAQSLRTIDFETMISRNNMGKGFGRKLNPSEGVEGSTPEKPIKAVANNNKLGVSDLPTPDSEGLSIVGKEEAGA